MPLFRKRHGIPKNYGYVPDPGHAEQRAVQSHRLYGSNPYDALKCDLNRSAYPSRALALMLGANPQYVETRGGLLVPYARNQSSHGSCVGHGEARKIEITIAAGMFLRGLRLDKAACSQGGKPAGVSPSFCYGASREWNRGRWEGSNGSWAAKATQELGFLFERDYPNFTRCSTYRTSDCDEWELRGVPREALQLSQAQTLEGFARVDNWEQAAALAHHGYAFNICGSPAPGTNVRDRYGAVRLTGQWAHSQCVSNYVVYDLGGGSYLRLFEIWNSHGRNRYSGGTGEKTPDLAGGAYYVTHNDLQRILNERDSWVNFDKKGLEPRAKNWRELAQKTYGSWYDTASLAV